MDSNQFSVVDDGNAVSEEVSLVHEVCGHDDGPARLVLDQQIPNATTRVRVHPSGRFVQNYNTILNMKIVLIFLIFQKRNYQITRIWKT